MYLDSPAAGVAILAERVAEGGLLSLTVKNAPSASVSGSGTG